MKSFAYMSPENDEFIEEEIIIEKVENEAQLNICDRKLANS